ncbi:MAG: hypothetical protein A6F71_09575 [Cycloclasticus sp. symbiont of Poecilosclerida sp. M]|nr:MAG: hypothetical protein A6F71_09575 [Cycloclasticus sp. symbiont of Poecilosclerida sp. M]
MLNSTLGWPTNAERLQYYFAANNITDAAVLLTVCGTQTFKLWFLIVTWTWKSPEDHIFGAF